MRQMSGHLWCSFTIVIWGLTFVATKVLLDTLSPFEILFDRSLIACLALLLITRSLPHFLSWRYTCLCLLAALCGNNLYFILENNALSFSYASNVSVLVSTAPLFTALLSSWCGQRGVLNGTFFTGFMLAMLGTVCLWWGSLELKLNPLGDMLALLAAISWAFYTMTIRKLVLLGYDTLEITKSLFLCACLLLLPLMPLYGYELKPQALLSMTVGGNLLFLGVLASAAGFLFWNKAVRLIGPVKTSLYIYAQPVVTALAAALLLEERPTLYTAVGIVLIIGGLVVSEQYNWRALKGGERD